MIREAVLKGRSEWQASRAEHPDNQEGRKNLFYGARRIYVISIRCFRQGDCPAYRRINRQRDTEDATVPGDLCHHSRRERTYAELSDDFPIINHPSEKN
jgi:ribosomal protein L15E